MARPRVDGWRRLHRLLAPGECLLCGAPAAGEERVCAPCRRDLPWVGEACPTCALPSPGGRPCGSCQRRAPPVERAYAPLLYREPLRLVVSRVKFHSDLAHGFLLGELLAGFLAEHPDPAWRRVDTLVPVPLAPGRLRARGYNQAREIAEVLAGTLGVGLDAGACGRLRETAPQSTLGRRRARERNLRRAFRAQPERVRGRRVAVVDDVVTTGVTVFTLAEALGRAGARSVQVWAPVRAEAPG